MVDNYYEKVCILIQNCWPKWSNNVGKNVEGMKEEMY